MIDVLRTLSGAGYNDAPQLLVIEGGDLAPALIMRIEAPELDAQDGRLQFIQAAVRAPRLMRVARRLAIIAQFAQLRRQGIVIRDHSAAIAVRAHIFGRVEAERAQMTDGPDLLPAVFGAVRLGAIFDQQQVMLVGEGLQGIHISRAAIQMHNQDGAAAFADGVTSARRIQREASPVDIGEHGNGARAFDGGDAGHGRMRNGDNFVARPDAAGAQGQLEGVGAVGDADCMPCAVISGEFRFKGFHFRSQDVPAAIGHTLHCGIDLVREQIMQGFELIERNHLGPFVGCQRAYYNQSGVSTYAQSNLPRTARRSPLRRQLRACQKISTSTRRQPGQLSAPSPI